MPSSLLVALQLAAMVAAVLPAGAASWHPAGYVPLAAAVGIGAWTLLHNRPGNFGIFPEPRERARLVTTGPYALVRHPMYLAMILMMTATPLALGSYWAMLPSIFFILLLAARAKNEEELLQKELKGYSEYMQKTRYRLFPGVW